MASFVYKMGLAHTESADSCIEAPPLTGLIELLVVFEVNFEGDQNTREF